LGDPVDHGNGWVDPWKSTGKTGFKAVNGLVLSGKLKPESPSFFHGKIDGFRLRFSQENQSIEQAGETYKLYRASCHPQKEYHIERDMRLELELKLSTKH